MLTASCIGSPWDEVGFFAPRAVPSQLLYQDKAMMSRWGLEGMGSFEQKSVARKEKPSTERAPSLSPDMIAAENALACCECSFGLTRL
jgi:hypothetical protein